MPVHARSLTGVFIITSARKTRGFTLVEGLVAGVLTVTVMGAVAFTFGSLFSTNARPALSYSGNIYELAPSFPNFRQALRLHFSFATAVDQADAVLVFGGSGSHPSSDPAGPSSVLSMSYVPTTLSAMTSADPQTQFSSWAQRSINGGQLSGQFVSAGSSADFTVLTVQGMSRVTSVTQQRRYTVTWNGTTVSLYEVTLQEVDWASGSAVLTTNPDTGTTPTYAYRVFYQTNEESWKVAPGATHYWFRTDSTWNRTEEGPCTVVFNDPFVLAGDTSGQIANISRFVYSLPVVR